MPEEDSRTSITFSDNADGYSPLCEEQELKVNRTKSPFEFNKGSERSSIFNLCASTLGGGCLSLPNATSKTGVLFGGILLLFFAFVTSFSLRCLANSGRATRRISYEDLSKHIFGKKMLIFVQVNIILFCMGTCVAYVRAIGDIAYGPLMPHLPDWIDRNVLMVFVWGVFMFPLSFFNKMDEMRFITLFGVMCIVYMVIAVSIHSATSLHEHHTPGSAIELMTFKPDVLLAMPTMMFAFTSHTQLPLIYESLVRPVERRMNKVIDRALLLVCLLYMCIGVFGAAEFGSNTNPNILQNYNINQSGETYMAVAFVTVSIIVMIAFPLNVFPARQTLSIVLFDKQDKDLPWKYYFPLTVVTTAIPLGLALVIPNIAVVFSFIGSTVSAFLCFILPGMFVIKIPVFRGTFTYWGAWGLIVFGVVIGVAGLAINIYTIATGQQ